MKASEIVAKAVRFKPFFKYSGGGLTLTGGEATEQPEFAAAILEGCRSEGIHAALETNGSCGPEILSRLAGLSDLILFDLKLFDDEAHRSLTGISNRRILSNAKLISGHPNMIVRIPLIPGMTDCDADLDATFSFMARTGLRRVSLLPYNPSTAAKYDWIGLSFSSNAETQTAERIREINGQASRYGIETVTI
jgi:pyruvate formate lyase activating enzyme